MALHPSLLQAYLALHGANISPSTTVLSLKDPTVSYTDIPSQSYLSSDLLLTAIAIDNIRLRSSDTQTPRFLVRRFHACRLGLRHHNF